MDSADLAAAPALLDALESTYLIRREINSFGRFSYEISHDTLLEPVLKARLAKDAAEAEQKRLAEEAAERERLRAEAEAQRLEREKISRARRRNALFSALAALLLGWALWQTWQAGKRSEEAQAAENKAKLAQNDADTAKAEALKAQEEAKEQKRIAELEKNNAHTKEEEAELATLRAKEQRRLAQKAGTSAVKSILEQARLDVFKLDYYAALEKLTSAADIGQMPDSVGLALMEIAFVDYHTGQTARADSLVEAIAPTIGATKHQILASFADQSAQRSEGVARSHPLTKAAAALHNRYFGPMIPIEGGSFDLEREEGGIAYRATLSRFRMAATETTWWQYNLFCEATRREKPKKSLDWGFQGDNPIVNVSWYDAVDYANWLSVRKNIEKAIAVVPSPDHGKISQFSLKLGSAGYRLPTEAEWEYAARAGKEYSYSGSDSPDEVAWYEINSSGHSRPVSSKKSNDWGLYDMSGNVWEWCWDWYGIYPSVTQHNPVGPMSGLERVLRGGSYSDDQKYLGAAYRYYLNPLSTEYFIGFRLVHSAGF